MLRMPSTTYCFMLVPTCSTVSYSSADHTHQVRQSRVSGCCTEVEPLAALVVWHQDRFIWRRVTYQRLQSVGHGVKLQRERKVKGHEEGGASLGGIC